MKMPKPDPKALMVFEALVPQGPAIKVKPMFGNFGAFANGKMFMGVFGDSVFVKLGETDRAQALALPGARLFEPMAGRAMKEYVVLPPSTLASKKQAQSWIRKSLDYAAAAKAKRAGGRAR